MAGLERASEHPLAEAIVRAAEERGLPVVEPTRFEAVPGQGIEGEVEGSRVLVGNESFLAARGCPPTADHTEWAGDRRRRGETVVFAALDGVAAAALAVADPIKASSAAAVSALRREGLELVMLTGDEPATAAAVAAELGIESVAAGLLPADKAAEIERLAAAGRRVAMAGDGVNDAPALARAAVGIAMGDGTDVAIESAGITLLKGDLQGLVRARRLARTTVRNIRQNLLFAFLYNTLGVPLAAGVLYPWLGLLLSPMVASAAMTLSSLSVIGNALRLRRLEL